MGNQKLTATAPTAHGVNWHKGAWHDESHLQSGVRVESRTSPPGTVELASSAHHRLLIHAGSGVLVSCHSQQTTYSRGDIDFLPAGLSDRWRVHSSSTTILVELPFLLFHHAAEQMGRDVTGVELSTRCHFRDPQIEYIAWALDAERQAGYPSESLYSDTLGIALALHLLGGVREPTRLLSGLSNHELRRVTTYIDENLHEDLSLAVLANVVGMSLSHFKTLFKRATGLPVHEYVIQQRVQRAKELLLHSTLPASQIALQVGFADQSHMARLMRRVLGVTPTALLHPTLDK